MKFDSKRKPIYVRLWINLVKVLGVAFVLAASFLLHQLFPQNAALVQHGTIVALLISVCVVAVIDTFLESMDVAIAIIGFLTLVALFILVIDVITYAERPNWSGGIFNAVMITIAVLIQLILSLNDAEMEGFASAYFYPHENIREGSFLAHLMLNTLPYVIGILGLHYTYNQFGVDMAAVLASSILLLLVVLAFADELIRHKQHWSIFWHNPPVSS